VEAEVDFADLWVILRGEKTKTFLFTLRLSYSGKSVHGRSSPKRRRRSWKVMSRRSPELGGTPIEKIRYDNLKAAVSRVLFGRDREESARWTAFKSHYPLTELTDGLAEVKSSQHPGLTSLPRAHALRTQTQPNLITGAVVIPERHTARGDEHRRMLDKQAAGCSFFVSQVLYDAAAAKNHVSDYRDQCDAHGVRPLPIVFTLSVCGSLKTLEFLDWLGVEVPRWMQRDLQRSNDTLGASLEHSRAVGLDVLRYCRRLGVPVGLNVESVSSRRVEIEAAIQLATGLRSALGG